MRFPAGLPGACSDQRAARDTPDLSRPRPRHSPLLDSSAASPVSEGRLNEKVLPFPGTL